MSVLRKITFAGTIMGLLALAAFTIAVARSGSPQQNLLLAPTAKPGDCYGQLGEEKADAKDENGSDGWSITAPAGYVIISLCIKTGQGGSEPAYFLTDENGIIEVGDQDCYSVDGIGTSTVSAENIVEDSACQQISHIEAKWAQATPTPSNTPTNTATYTFTPSNTPTPSETPTNTPTPTETPTPSDTPTSSSTATDTPTPSETPTDTSTPTDTPTPSDTPTNTSTPTDTLTPSETSTETATPTETQTPSETPTPSQTSTPSSETPTATPTATLTATRTPTRTPTRTFTPSNTPTVIIPVTGGLTLLDPCTTNPGVTLAWQVRNNNAYSVNIVWWVLGGTATGGPLVVPATSTISFDSPIDGPLPNTLAIMWIDPADGQTKSISAANFGRPCTGQDSSPTPTATSTPGALIPVTGANLPTLLRDNMVLNMGLGVIGFVMILFGIGIMRRRRPGEEEAEG